MTVYLSTGDSSVLIAVFASPSTGVRADAFIGISTTALFAGAVAQTRRVFTARCGCSLVSPAAFDTTAELAAEKCLEKCAK